jgi:osmotically-inducible protein OsmY
MDNDRRKWTWSLYGSDWADTGLYDIVINLEQISVEDACEIVCSTSRLKFFESSVETRAYLEDLATASRVKAHLAMDPTTCDQEFQVLAQGASVTIKGEIASWHQANDVARIARAVPGVVDAHVGKLAVIAQI